MRPISLEKDKFIEGTNQDSLPVQKHQEIPFVDLQSMRGSLLPKMVFDGAKKPYRMSIYEFSPNSPLYQKEEKKKNPSYLNFIYNKYPYTLRNKKIAICSIVPQM